MSEQERAPELQFPSESPINALNLGKQNKLVYDHLLSGKTINCVEAQDLFITALNSRISELRNKYEIEIFDRFVNIGTGKSRVKEYSLTEFQKK